MAEITVGEPPEARQPESPSPTPDPQPTPQPEPDTRVWATADLLGADEPWAETQLPILQQWVKVRYLGTEDISPLQYLPDYVGFIELCLKLAGSRQEQESVNPIELEQETIRYQAHIAHLAMLDPSIQTLDDTIECDDCAAPDQPSVIHPRTLLSVKQARRLPSPDLEHVADIALQADRVLRMRPFSEALQEVASRGPATTGAPIQPTN